MLGGGAPEAFCSINNRCRLPAPFADVGEVAGSRMISLPFGDGVHDAESLLRAMDEAHLQLPFCLALHARHLTRLMDPPTGIAAPWASSAPAQG